ncbi:MAG: hypothetical protein O3C05_02770 [Proteobacteria bacterium]|nr:hypothetical protein [Pseudomonadota bacterium]
MLKPTTELYAELQEIFDFFKPQFGVLESNFRADILRGSIV